MTTTDIAPTRRIDRDDLLEISGLAAYNEQGQEVYPRDLLKQTRYVLDELMQPILEEAGATFDDVARLSVFTTSMREWPGVWDKVKSTFQKAPALTVVEIPRLVGEIAMVELEISAGVPQEVGMASRHTGTTGAAVEISPKSLADRDWKLHAAAFKMGQGDLLFVSGLGPTDDSGKTVGKNDPGAQTRQILSTMDAILREAGGTIDDVVRLRVFATDMKNRPAINAERMKTFKEPRAVSTFVQVSGLEEDDWLVAMEATAFIPKQG